MANYQRVIERFESGDFSDFIMPLDFLILEELPPQGTNVGGVYQVGKTSNDLGKKFGLPASMVATRTRFLKQLGLTVTVKILGASGSLAWQVTPKAKEVMAAWKAQQS